MVYKEGKRWHNESCIVFYKNSLHKKFAVVASKKIGKAVERNRAKRLLRAVFIRFAANLESGIYIMVVKNSLLDLPFVRIEKNLSWSLKKLGCYKE